MKDLTFADIKFNLEQFSITSEENFQNIRLKDTNFHPVQWGKSVGTKLRICRLFIGVSQEKKNEK